MTVPHQSPSVDAARRIPLAGLEPEEIAAALDLAPFQGRQLFRWLHAKRAATFEGMTDLSKALRQTLQERCCARELRLLETRDSGPSGAKKALFELHDGQTVESVLLRDRDRVTLCLSSQAGCAIGCPFCATGQSGFARNLAPGEIVEQALSLLDGEDLAGRTPNIVYMGMGEPFWNYEAVMKSIGLLNRKDGLGIGARRITVSTAGDAPGIRRFAREDWQARLAVSLHAANDRLRSRLAPLNRKYPLADLMAAVREYASVTGRQVSFEWVLLRGENDAPEHTHELARLVEGLDCVVNLIPYNPVEAAPFTPPSRKDCEAFRDSLLRADVKATLRQERGQNIDAACGQLRARARPAAPCGPAGGPSRGSRAGS